MKKTGSSERRQFLKESMGVLGATLLVGISAQAEEERRRKKPEAAADAKGGDADLPLVDPATDPMAVSTNYVTKHANMKKADLKTERQGVKFEDQTCAKCMLYTAAGKKGGKEVGKCTLFAGKLVEAGGWCSTWSKKV